MYIHLGNEKHCKRSALPREMAQMQGQAQTKGLRSLKPLKNTNHCAKLFSQNNKIKSQYDCIKTY